ncbi:Long-chain-alcohol O-fatty-acyltransferase [Bertholletia excelsa]
MEAPAAPSDLKPIRTARDRESWTGCGRPLSPMARIFHEPGSNVYIIAILGSKTTINPDDVKAKLTQTLLKHPRFSSLQVVDEATGEIRWVPTKVNLDDHVVAPNLDPHLGSPDKVVEDYISNLTKTTIEKSKPLWDLHILNVRISDAAAVGVFRIHHSLGDGMSLISLLLACTRKVSNPAAVPVVPTAKEAEVMKKNFDGVWPFLRLVWNTITGVLLFIATALFLKDTNTPLKGPPGCEHRPRRIIKRTVSLDDVKLIKKAIDVTINDVVLGVTQAGLSQYLNRRYGEIKSRKGKIDEKKNYLPSNVRFRATLFINIRPSAGIQALVDMMEKGSSAKWGNKIGYVLLPFTIGFQEDPLDYIYKAKAAIDRKKSSLEPIYSYIFAKFLIRFFGVKAAGILNHRIFSNTTLWFSNVPGPQDEIAFYGNEMAYFAPTCYGQPNALMIHVVSYIDRLTFVISADEETIPDPHQLCDDLEESLKLIKAALDKRAGVKQD